MKEEIYDILVKHAGASERERDQFYALFPCSEWRFQGKLGFGGKLRIHDGRVWIDYYKEDETEEREKIAGIVNYALKRFEPVSSTS